VYNHIRGGKLETIRTLGGSQRVLLTSLDQAQSAQADVYQGVQPTRAAASDSDP
jgi:hypothetical protein